MDTNYLDAQEAAFRLLVKICKTTEPALTLAFDNVENYTTHQIPKRSGGMRLISEPHESLKKIQKKLLTWLYRLERRDRYYSKNFNARQVVYYREIFDCSIDPSIHGSIFGRSTATAVTQHTDGDACFLIKIDLKQAFPSVKTEHVIKTLRKTLLTECRAYFFTYQRKRYDTDGWRREMNHRFPLFSSNDCSEFRSLIRSLARSDKKFEDSIIPQIIEHFVTWFGSLVTWQGSLPQGAPTSGFLLNMVISQTDMLWSLRRNCHWNKVSIYVDDLIITSRKKPDTFMINWATRRIREAGIFEHNPKKVQIHDLRKHSGPVLGMKLVRRSAREDEIEAMCNDDYFTSKRPRRGFKKRMKVGGTWSISCLALPKKVQKQYRAWFHRCVTQNVSQKEIDRAHGYFGHLISVYGSLSFLPSSVKKVINEFRDKFVRI